MDCLNCESVLPGVKIITTAEGNCIKCGKKITPITERGVEDMAFAHWAYIYSTIHAHTGMEEESKEYITNKHHYLTAFIHGFKHGQSQKRQ